MSLSLTFSKGPFSPTKSTVKYCKNPSKHPDDTHVGQDICWSSPPNSAPFNGLFKSPPHRVESNTFEDSKPDSMCECWLVVILSAGSRNESSSNSSSSSSTIVVVLVVVAPVMRAYPPVKLHLLIHCWF